MDRSNLYTTHYTTYSQTPRYANSKKVITTTVGYNFIKQNAVLLLVVVAVVVVVLINTMQYQSKT